MSPLPCIASVAPLTGAESITEGLSAISFSPPRAPNALRQRAARAVLMERDKLARAAPLHALLDGYSRHVYFGNSSLFRLRRASVCNGGECAAR